MLILLNNGAVDSSHVMPAVNPDHIVMAYAEKTCGEEWAVRITLVEGKTLTRVHKSLADAEHHIRELIMIINSRCNH